MSSKNTDKFNLLLQEIISKQFLETSETIFHYTNIDTLFKILDKDKIKLWFSKYDCLNDLSEGKEVRQSFNMAVKSFEDNIFYKNIYNIKPSTAIFENRINYNDPYICCFSSQKDSLDLWRSYSKNLNYGCNIGLKTKFLNKELKNNGYLTVAIQKVLYEKTEKLNYWKEKIKKVYESYYLKYDDLEDSVKILSFLLAKKRFIFKHKCFQSENESRAIAYIPDNKLNTVQYRTKDDMIIPYIEFEFDTKCLSSITFSPLIKHKSQTLQALKKYLDINGYKKNIKIDFSKLPIRF